MKMILLIRRATAWIVAVAILAAITFTAFAQSSKGVEEKNRAVAEKAAADAGASRVAFDIHIVNGQLIGANGNAEEATLDKVIDLVRARHPEANIVLSPRLPVIRISNLKLRATSLEQELEALRVASGNKFTWDNGRPPALPQPPAFDPATGMPVAPAAHSADVDPATGNELPPLYILGEVPNAPDRHRVEVFNLNAYIDRLDSQEKKDVDARLHELQEIILSTVQNQSDLSAEDGLKFTFHPGAKLLIVSGPTAAVDIARKVIVAVGGLSAGSTKNDSLETFRGVVGDILPPGYAGGGLGASLGQRRAGGSFRPQPWR